MASVIFDLDGTLIDSAPDIHAAANRVLAEAGADPLDFFTVRSFIGNGVPVLVDRIIAARSLTVAKSELEARFLAHYEADSTTLTRLYPGVRDALSDLAGSGVRLGICTNKPEAPTRAILAAFGLQTLFSVVIGGDSLAVRKPDPAPLLAARAALGAPALFVGDSEVDAETARAAALPFALFTEGYRKAPVASLVHAAAFADYADLAGLVRQTAGR